MARYIISIHSLGGSSSCLVETGQASEAAAEPVSPSRQSLCRFESAIPSVVVIVAASLCAPFACAQAAEPAKQLVREVVYNELHDHQNHAYWRYWVKQRTGDGTRVEDQVETASGPVARVILSNGHPLDDEGREADEQKLQELVSSPSEQKSHRDAYAEDQDRVTRILALLPDAFDFEDAGQANGCEHLRFHPNPAYSARTVEARVFHALNGELWIDTRMKRLKKLQGRLDDDLTFGLGLLGRVNKGSWFEMDRAQVSPSEWKTTQLEIHMSGRAILFKTVGRDISEERGGFSQVASGLSMADGVRLLNRADPERAMLASAMYAGGR